MNLIRNPKSSPVLVAVSADGRTRRREATVAGESSMLAKTFGVSAANGGSSSPLLDVTNVGGAEKYLASPDRAPKAFASRLADPPISNRFCCRGGRVSRKFWREQSPRRLGLKAWPSLPRPLQRRLAEANFSCYNLQDRDEHNHRNSGSDRPITSQREIGVDDMVAISG